MEIAILVAIVLGLTEVVKRTGKVKENYIPLIALLVGVMASVGTSYGAGNVGIEAVFTGIVAGLMAMGLFSGGKASLK